MRDKADSAFLVARGVEFKHADQELLFRIGSLEREGLAINADLPDDGRQFVAHEIVQADRATPVLLRKNNVGADVILRDEIRQQPLHEAAGDGRKLLVEGASRLQRRQSDHSASVLLVAWCDLLAHDNLRSEEHTSEL